MCDQLDMRGCEVVDDLNLEIDNLNEKITELETELSIFVNNGYFSEVST